jgi:hypothetical protein
VSQAVPTYVYATSAALEAGKTVAGVTLPIASGGSIGIFAIGAARPVAPGTWPRDLAPGPGPRTWPPDLAPGPGPRPTGHRPPGALRGLPPDC